MLDPFTAAASLGEVLGLGPVDEDELYVAHDWLGERQTAIEKVRSQNEFEGQELQDLDEVVRAYIAWTSVLEKERLNLDPHQVRQAETQQKSADGAVRARMPEAYQWLHRYKCSGKPTG